ncbi:serine protein kinase [Xylaria scruposa]|nr:serine protein kinase [Xylaria scruposa]
MSISPPPTPPSKGPNKDERRFKEITSPCEWVEDYHPGGYHPVTLGDIFKDGQYKVIRKLGEGGYSTVWLAHDLRNNIYVALKIMVSEISESTNESQILRHLFQVAPEGAKHITQLIDEFEHCGPNGVHKCLIFEPMGPNVNCMVEELPQFKPRRWGMKIRYPYWMAKSILRQALESLVFLHGNGIAHGDFQPGNMLFALSSINSKSEDELRQKEDAQTGFGFISPPVQRLDGKQDKWAPPYLCIAQPLVYPSDYARGFKIKLSDLGGAYFLKEPPAKPLTPAGLRPPEFVLTGAVNQTFDVWSFGCLVFELVTGWPLFCIPYPSKSERDDSHLLAFTRGLGPLPENLYKHWTTSSLYFTPDRELYNCQLGGVIDGEPLMLEQLSMEEYFDQANPDIDEREARKVKALVRRILQYDPAERPSAAEVLRDPWFFDDDEIGSSPSS